MYCRADQVGHFAVEASALEAGDGDALFRLLVTMTLNELAEELAGWARGAKRALAGTTPPPDALMALLALWVEPEAAVGLDWRAAVDLLIAERPVARAARYLALRSRRANRGGGAS